jgi:hypothetical protein
MGTDIVAAAKKAVIARPSRASETDSDSPIAGRIAAIGLDPRMPIPVSARIVKSRGSERESVVVFPPVSAIRHVPT